MAGGLNMESYTTKEQELLKKAIQRKEQLLKDKKQEEEFLIKRDIENLKKQYPNKENDLSFKADDKQVNITLNQKSYTFNRDIAKSNKEEEIKWEENRLYYDIKENHKTILNKYSMLRDKGRIKDFDYFQTNFDFQKVIKEKAINFIKDYENDNKNSPWFFIYGQYGSGKTLICEVIINELLKKFKLSVLYSVFNSLMIELKGLSNNIQQTELLKRIDNFDILFIDDLFKNQNITNSDINLFFNIINNRYVNNKVTILNSQKLFKNIALFDSALFSRIAEKANKYLIKISYNENYNYRLIKQFLNKGDQSEGV